MKHLNDAEIINSWHANAAPWIKAIANEEIESRKLVTNGAIISLIKELKPATLLDIGCGEGWLERYLAGENIQFSGVDVVPELVESAAKQNKGKYETCAYEDLASHDFGQKFDVTLCNFSLIGKESTEEVFKAARKFTGGKFIIQTLHPVMACGDAEYKDSWREGSWAGFSNEFTKPAPWYFRTIESWKGLFEQSGFKLEKPLEPISPKTNKPASIIFVAS